MQWRTATTPFTCSRRFEQSFLKLLQRDLLSPKGCFRSAKAQRQEGTGLGLGRGRPKMRAVGARQFLPGVVVHVCHLELRRAGSSRPPWPTQAFFFLVQGSFPGLCNCPCHSYPELPCCHAPTNPLPLSGHFLSWSATLHLGLPCPREPPRAVGAISVLFLAAHYSSVGMGLTTCPSCLRGHCCVFLAAGTCVCLCPSFFFL